MSDKISIKDRIGQYLIIYMNDFIFDELSEGYLTRAGAKDILLGVPVPIAKTELAELTNVKIARAMAMVMGCDANFKYAEQYAKYIERTFGEDFIKPLINEGVELAAKGEPQRATMFFRGALAIRPDDPDALYCYGRACKDAYEAGDGEEYVGRFKAESLEAFERLTIIKPDFDMGFYYLAYAYLNMGLYIKADLTFAEFIKLTEDAADEEKLEMRSEAMSWREKLEEPVKIEQGYNHVLAGRYEEGIAALEEYKEDSRFSSWWPLWYYLAMAYRGVGDDAADEECLRKVLTLSPSNVQAMSELANLYERRGDTEKARKYSDKIKTVERNREEYIAEKNIGTS